MKTFNFFLLLLFFQCGVTASFAKTEALEFMTPRDVLLNNSTSNINLKNNRNSAASVYGLYVRQFGYVIPGDTCDHATSMYASTQNTAAGSFVTSISLNAGKSAAVGSHYLYNMIYEALYYVSIMSTPACFLPGCTWGTDSTIYDWCIYLGALSPVITSAGYTANVPPSGEVASSTGLYDYNLINDYVSLGPISCDDQTLTCTTTRQQTQSFS